MIFRLSRRVSTVVLVVFLVTAPNVFGAVRESDGPKDARDRVVRIIKKIKSILIPTTLDGEGITPPKP